VAGLGAGLVASALAPREAQAANGNALTLGTGNNATLPTVLSFAPANPGDHGPGLQVSATESGPTNSGVVGTAPDGNGVYGQSPDGVGVRGETDNHTGVLGIRGTALPSALLEGGVSGASSEDVPGVAAKHTSPGGLALQAEGRVQFSSAGRAQIPKGQYQTTVSLPGVVFADSVVIVTLNTNPGNGALKYVTVQADQFTVVLNPPSLVGVGFSYLVLNGAPPIV
jgi:hypothetical protein